MRRRFEVTFLPGLGAEVTAEVAELSKNAAARPVSGRDDALEVTLESAARLLSMRTAVAVSEVLAFTVPRPRSLLSGEYLPLIAAAVRRVNGARSFRIEAAGSDSAVFARLASALSDATGLVADQADGDAVLRFRRSPDGWDVLVRLTGRPLSHRPWRVRNVPGAVNATIAAAVARQVGVRRADRVVNLMCGSGTLLIERLLAGPARRAVGVDHDPDMLAACAENLAAAGVHADLVKADVTATDWQDAGPFDVLLADPPWGTLVGDHAGNEDLHLDLLRRAAEAAAPRARLAVLTHEIKRMERCLRRTENLWQVATVTRVFQKGHHPRVYVLNRVS
ncbi:methyltransferase domain-containing protein [Virgisporangium aurantiacum]|uniref:RNA methyltransferase n=1 Tax=Virgisporangium aurantiacum TaxID=175570 RepID=A0A8J3Z0C9_9ACTN|nr:methyltransferase domain-containing protein [Virgisporangium aurantiacum]GIJ54974.1 RNA methyltransferase [Virgisporangium aurantiacum]